MANLTTGYSWLSGDTVTPGLLNQTVNSATISEITNADISASANIALSKLATGALPGAITVSTDNIVNGTIVDADINSSAAIAGTKVAPNFGSQNVSTTGSVSGASVAASGNITATGAASVAVTASTTGTDSLPAVLLQNDARSWRIQVQGTSADELYFYDDTAAALRMAINSSGHFLVGTSGLNGAGGFSVAPNGTGGAATAYFNRTNTASVSVPLTFANGGSNVGSISYNNTVTAYNTSSDHRLKENVTPMATGLSVVDQLQPLNFTWKIDGSAGRGFIAHELQAVVPEAVTGEKDAVDAEGNPQYQGVDPSKLVPFLVAAIKELKARVEALEAK